MIAKFQELQEKKAYIPDQVQINTRRHPIANILLFDH
ncbi:unnamed protein product [Paramecium sonneborni]|uniref:Uncharacterized protein n=1 Tax=Paramecium sonneborni TaxID=65129 RepID=A0A8S1RTT5_9CILI|nr:unnamed protein product [Paramecium sonneborni]CAD8131396.1 unnamed protein product [Paramecium sonneborni]